MSCVISSPIRCRFWFAILLASVFGTNAGDLLAGPLHLGHWRGLPVLAVLFVASLVLAHRRSDDAAVGEGAFWSAIVVLRTGATNIADLANHEWHLGGRMLLPALLAGFVLLALLDQTLVPGRGDRPRRLGSSYWLAMLAAGVLGTVGGDAAEDQFGDGGACLLLAVLAGPMLALRIAGRSPGTAAYWLAVGLNRILGTVIGDTIADRGGLGFGIELATALTGSLFVLLVAGWRPGATAARPGKAASSPSVPSPAAPR